MVFGTEAFGTATYFLRRSGWPRISLHTDFLLDRVDVWAGFDGQRWTFQLSSGLWRLLVCLNLAVSP
jgi:hypothetical protein